MNADFVVKILIVRRNYRLKNYKTRKNTKNVLEHTEFMFSST
ncbi:hypothetical protein FLCH110379_06775 [Flavobacterium chungbukense]